MDTLRSPVNPEPLTPVSMFWLWLYLAIQRMKPTLWPIWVPELNLPLAVG